MLASLKDWVDAAHFYRHEPGTEEVAQPPLPLAVYLVSIGASHLRWLAELDGASGLQLRRPRGAGPGPCKSNCAVSVKRLGCGAIRYGLTA